MKYAAVYITASNIKEAKKLADLLVKERLAACINIIPNIESVYFWKGKLVNDKEVLMLGKTRKSLAKKIIETVKKHHSYTAPCITFLPIIDGNKEYLDWIGKRTK
ncbi:MAG: divalent-cation tolerance protein CutA [Candidatus Aenigmarchaeota archaeon]|nr:divalent-cation tolerance protein CutA [Candidatus Aenigmarchaeota archaeon]